MLVSENERSRAIARRRARIIGYIKAGVPVPEICDLEGIDPANEPKRLRREIAEPEGLTLTLGRARNPPVGLLDIDRVIRLNLKVKLEDLRAKHHFNDVSHLVGLTKVEQHRAITAPYTHNWTLAQIQRLAAASGMTFEDMMDYMRRSHIVDFRKEK